MAGAQGPEAAASEEEPHDGGELFYYETDLYWGIKEAREAGELEPLHMLTDEQATAAADAARAQCHAVAVFGGTKNDAIAAGVATWQELERSLAHGE